MHVFCVLVEVARRQVHAATGRILFFTTNSSPKFITLLYHYLSKCRRFDESLKSRDPSWGVRNLEDVLEAARENGLVHQETIEMPVNNLSVILKKV